MKDNILNDDRDAKDILIELRESTGMVLCQDLVQIKMRSSAC